MNKQNLKNDLMKIKSKFDFQKTLLVFLVIAVWLIVFQNFGLISGAQNVEVVNELDTRMKGVVYVRGIVGINNVVGVEVENTVDVEVENTVDINIEEINGKRNVFYDRAGNKNYHRIPVYTGN